MCANPYLVDEVDLQTGTWYHAVFTYDQSELNLYVDGVPGAPVEFTDSPTAPAAGNVWVGRDYDDFYDGKLSDVRYFDQALSEEQIMLHFFPEAGPIITGANNQLLRHGAHSYTYDAEGNRTARFVDEDVSGTLNAGDTDITLYDWDHRNRLVRVTEKDTHDGPATKTVEHTYDAQNQWISRTVDLDGDPGTTADIETTIFVYDRGQIIYQFDHTGTGDVQAADLTHRYLWGPGTDQLLADEQVTSLTTAGQTLWALADHLGTIRDIVDNSGALVAHILYDAFGNTTSIVDGTGSALTQSPITFGLRNF